MGYKGVDTTELSSTAPDAATPLLAACPARLRQMMTGRGRARERARVRAADWAMRAFELGIASQQRARVRQAIAEHQAVQFRLAAWRATR
jgi:alkylation response protein AidB-like acyl-CoA dehydrogenase